MRKHSVVLCALALVFVWAGVCFSYGGMRVGVPLPDGGTIPAYLFLPSHGCARPLPGVVVAVGVGSQLIPQYHDHCRHLADSNFAVLLIDPSNYPESLVPHPYTWDKGMGYVKGSVNQAAVAARLAISVEWYLDGLKAAFDYMCMQPTVDRSRLVLSGFSQPANAALTYASKDPRVRAVVWNYGGSPWVMPYNVLRLPPVLIFHGEKDDVYDVKYAHKLAEDLRTNMKYHFSNIYPNEKHMFNVNYDLFKENWHTRPVIRDAFQKLVCFLNDVLMIPASSPHQKSSKRKAALTDARTFRVMQ